MKVLSSILLQVLLLSAALSHTALAQSSSQDAFAAEGRFNSSAAPQFTAGQIRSYSALITASGDPADIYYPKLPAKRRHAFTDRFPVVIMLQGALVGKEFYSQFALNVARYGFVVVVPNHRSALLNTNLFTEMNVITDALAFMREEDSSQTSPVRNIADTSRLGLTGHSFGGATALFAIGNYCVFPFCNSAEGFQRPPELQAAALSGTHAPDLNFATDGIAVALLGGSEEANMLRIEATYANLPAPKALISITGANHFGMNDINRPPGAQINPEDPEQSIPQAITALRFADWAGLFLSAHIHRDRSAWRKIYRSGGAQGVSVQGEAR